MHVLVYVMDALRADFLSCYGHDYETSPEIDEFASEAVRFTNAYSPATWTKPAAATFLTGRQPRAVNMMRFLDRLPDLDSLLPRLLRTEGFESHAVSTNPLVAEEFGFTGFDSFTHLQKDPNTRRDRLPSETRGVEDEVHDRLGINSAVVPLSEDVNEVLFDFYEDVDADGDSFALAWSIDTHGPYFVRGEESAFGNDPDDVVRESELSAENVDRVRSLYRDMVRYNDRQFGRLLRKLEAEGLYEDALIVLAADHGESFGDHEGILGKPIFGHSGVVYEEVVNVPLFVKFPDGEYAGREVETPVHLTDVYPTVADVCGLDWPDEVHGQSLYPPDDVRERPIFVESQTRETTVYSGAVRRGDEKYLRTRKDWHWRRNWRRMAETLLWKFTMPSTLLFDLADDPDETEDLSEDRPETVAELSDTFDSIRDGLDEAAEDVAAERLDGIADDTERQLRGLGYLE